MIPNKPLVQKVKQKAVKAFQNTELTKDEQVNSLVNCADELEELHTFSKSTKENFENTLTWKADNGESEFRNRNRVVERCSGKMPVEIFEILFCAEIRTHLIEQTINYAHVEHNDLSFTLNDDILKKYVAILLYSGYHSLPQQALYWERNEDVSTLIVYQSMAKNRFYEIKRYTHCADNGTHLVRVTSMLK